MKPRFPLSVTRHFYYRATKPGTGELLDCDDFKTLYQVTRSFLRSEIGCPDCEEYSETGAVLSFGYQTLYEVKPGYYYSEWKEIETFGYFYITSLTESFRRTSDLKEVVNKRTNILNRIGVEVKEIAYE